MTREEVKKILMTIDAAYPSFKVTNPAQTIDAWHFFLEDFDYGEISIALKTYVSTAGKGFAPSVDQLIAMANKPKELTQLTENQAWDMVTKAIRRSTYYAEEEYEKLPEIVQQAVGSPNMLRVWASSDLSALETVVASNFQRTFRTVVERQRQFEMMPKEAKARIETFQNALLEARNEEE